MERIKSRGMGRAWVELLESDLSTSAKLCYCVMTSFGPESRASLESIGRRMSREVKAIREAQKELLEAGWIKLLGGGFGDEPREWEVLDSQGSPKPAPLFEEGCLKPAPLGVPKTGTLNKEVLNKEVLISESDSIKGFNAQKAVAWFCDRRKDKYGTAYSLTGPDQGALKALFKNGNGPAPTAPSEEVWKIAVSNFLEDESPYTGQHRLKALLENFNRYNFKREKYFVG